MKSMLHVFVLLLGLGSSALAADKGADGDHLKILAEKYAILGLFTIEKKVIDHDEVAIMKPIEIFQGDVSNFPKAQFIRGRNFLKLFEKRTVIYGIEKVRHGRPGGTFILSVNEKDKFKHLSVEFDEGFRLGIEQLRKLKKTRKLE